MDHAVLAVRYEQRWVILDNRTSLLVDPDNVAQFTPLFTLGGEGVKLFAAPYTKSNRLQTAEVLAHFRALAADLPARRGVVVGSTELEYRTFGRQKPLRPGDAIYRRCPRSAAQIFWMVLVGGCVV